MVVINDIHDALVKFEKFSSKWGEANKHIDYRRGNKLYFSAIESIKYINKTRNMDKLIPFLHHTDVGVRYIAAYVLLPYKTRECKEVLQKIVECEDRINSFSAEMTLEEWNKGTLTFPFSIE